MNDHLKQLHTTWCELTRQELHPRATERLFFEFWNMGFTEDDLRCVIMYYLRFNRENTGAQFRINVNKVIGDLENFAGVLAEARAKERNRLPKATPQQAVRAVYEQRAAVGRPAVEPSGTGPKSFKDVLKALEHGEPGGTPGAR